MKFDIFHVFKQLIYKDEEFIKYSVKRLFYNCKFKFTIDLSFHC
jgi:hypothetical protein